MSRAPEGWVIAACVAASLSLTLIDGATVWGAALAAPACVALLWAPGTSRLRGLWTAMAGVGLGALARRAASELGLWGRRRTCGVRAGAVAAGAVGSRGWRRVVPERPSPRRSVRHLPTGAGGGDVGAGAARAIGVGRVGRRDDVGIGDVVVDLVVLEGVLGRVGAPARGDEEIVGGRIVVGVVVLVVGHGGRGPELSRWR